MADKSIAYRTALIALLFNGDTTDIDGITDGTDLFISFHIADPAGGHQATSAATYTDYARVPVARDNTGFTCTANVAENADDISGVQAGAGMVGTQTITHVGIGRDLAGNGLLLYSKALAVPYVVGALSIPKILAGQLTVTET